MSDKLAKVYDVGGVDSIEAVLDLSHTNWDAIFATPQGFQPGGYRAIVRPDTNTALAFVGNKTRLNSHRRQLGMLDSLVSSGDLVPVTVSMWDNGAILAYQFRAPGLDVTILGKDVVSPLLTLVFAYGFKLADSAFFADFRWFCKNQMGTVSKLMTDRVRHMGNVLGNYGDLVGKRLSELSGELSEHYSVMRRMTEKPLTGKPLYEYFGQAIGLEKAHVEQAWVTPAEDLKGAARAIPDVLDCYAADDAGAPSTVWQAYNAVTRYETHKHGHNPETRARRMLLGAGAKTANDAFDQARRIVA